MILELVILLTFEETIRILDSVDFSKDIERMFEWDWSMESLHDVDGSVFSATDPIGKVHIVGDSCTEHDESDMFWKHDDGLFPNHPSFWVVDIVDLIENHPLDVSDHL